MGISNLKKETKRKDSHKKSISEPLSGANIKVGFLLCVGKMQILKAKEEKINTTFDPAKVIQISWNFSQKGNP